VSGPRQARGPKGPELRPGPAGPGPRPRQGTSVTPPLRTGVFARNSVLGNADVMFSWKS
jgi:hypothetical protein